MLRKPRTPGRSSEESWRTSRHMHNVRTPKTVIAHDHNDFGWPAYSFFVGQSPIVFFLNHRWTCFFLQVLFLLCFVYHAPTPVCFVRFGILILEIKIQLQYIVSLFPCVPCILHYIKIEINTFMDKYSRYEHILYLSMHYELEIINRTHAQTSGFFNSSEIKLFLDFLGWLPITNHHWIIIEYDTFVIRSRLVLLPRLLRHALDLARHRRSTRRCAASGADNGCGAVEFNQENLGLSVEETI